MDKRIFVKNIRSWYTEFDYKNRPFQAPYKIIDKTHLKDDYQKFFKEVAPKIDSYDPVYVITSQAWFFGINTSPLTNLKLGRVTHRTTVDKSASLVSILPEENVVRRKIIDKIKISCDKNLVPKNVDMLEYTILRVKRSIYKAEATHSWKTNGLRTRSLSELSSPSLTPPLIGFTNETNDLKTHVNSHICNDQEQLVPRGSFFSSSEVVLDSLDYDLGLDNLILVQKISFDKSIEAGFAGKDASRDMYFGLATREFADYRIEVEYSYSYI